MYILKHRYRYYRMLRKCERKRVAATNKGLETKSSMQRILIT